MEKLYRYFIIYHNRPKSHPNENQNQSNQTKTNKTMISMAQMKPMFQLFQTMTQKLEQPIQIEKLNYQNYTTWCKQMKTEIDDRRRLNYIIVIPSSTRIPQPRPCKIFS